MPARWDVDGTTGYELLACASGLFVDATQARRFDELTARFVGEHRPFHVLVREKKLFLMRSSMASEVAMLGRRLNRISEQNRRTRDFTLSALTTAIIEYIAALPIYRTYVEGTTADDVDARDRKTIEAAIARARRHATALNPSVFDFLRDVLLLVDPNDDKIEFVRKLQQVTPPVTAKAIEDTAFYCDHRLVALNEVGGDPERFGSTPADFHRLAVERTRRFGGSLSATSTHDTKRSEDVRLRIAALSQLPDAWEETLARLADLVRPWKSERDGEPVPSANDELAFYQAALGVLPEETLAGGPVPPDVVARLVAYMEKALREAKVETSWTNPNEAYEAAMARVVRAALADDRFLAILRPLAARCARVGRVSSLSLCALKLAAPGITDVYQGCELEDLSLVDPDNRRPVDWERRRALLAAIDARLADGPVARRELAREVGRVSALADGRAKLLLLAEGLRHRRAHRALYRRGRYLPIDVVGPDAHRLVAFARIHDGQAVLCVAPRLVAGALGEGDRGPLALRAELRLPPGLADELAPLVDIVTGVERAAAPRLAADALLADFPVALLAATQR
jgi:(1->4)-alpha-D-glucan 1-alpha-D-glucosylmutase